MINNIVKIKKGKNKGKTNETTPYQQAINEANSKINKKKDEGYTENIHDVTKVFSRPLPMLAHDFNKRGKDISFPCFVQPKLDGIRTIYDPVTKKLYSRNNKNYLHFKEILEELKDVSLILDGEVYSHDISFEDFVGLSKKIKLSKKDKETIDNLRFYIYDFIDTALTYKERYKVLQDFFKKHKFNRVILLETLKCNNKNEAKMYLENYIQKGYEGLILRNKNGLYSINQRSKDLQKYKLFKDDEYEIIGAKHGIGREEGAIIWSCITKNGLKFDVRPRGSIKERVKLYKIHKKYIGKMLTVKFFRLTKEGVPLFPTTLHNGLAAIRE